MLYNFAKLLFITFVKVWFRWEVRGKDNIPVQGPVVVVANHASLWDPIILGVALPRKINYMAKEELFRNPLLGWVMPRMGAFPVKRGKSDRAALKAALDILAENKLLGLFPEGTRSETGQLMEFQAGAALMAVKGGAPVIPVAIKGTLALKLSFKRKVSVIIGKPMYIHKQDRKRLNSKELAGAMEELRGQVNAMMQLD